MSDPDEDVDDKIAEKRRSKLDDNDDSDNNNNDNDDDDFDSFKKPLAIAGGKRKQQNNDGAGGGGGGAFGEASNRDVFEAKKRRKDVRIGDTSDAEVHSGLRTTKTRRVQTEKGVAETLVIDQVEGEEADAREEESYIVNGESVDIEPFNLEQERQDGYFDEEGHYVEKGFNADGTKKRVNDEDDDDENALSADPWLGEVDEWSKANGKKAIEQVELAHRVQEARIAMENEAKPIDVDQCMKVLDELIKDDEETVREAMTRLRPARKERRRVHYDNNNDDDGNATSSSSTTKKASSAIAKPTVAELEAQATFTKLFDATNDLVALGFTEVYDATKKTAVTAANDNIHM